MLEMSKHKDIYKLIFTILQNFATELTIFIFCDSHNDKNIYDLLHDIRGETEQMKKFVSNVDDCCDEGDIEDVDGEISQMVTFLYEMVTPCYKSYMELRQKLREEGKQASDSRSPLRREEHDVDKEVLSESHNELCSLR